MAALTVPFDPALVSFIRRTLSVAETGRVEWNPSAVYIYADDNRFKPPRKQVTLSIGFTEGGGNLKKVLQRYIDKGGKLGAEFAPYLPSLGSGPTLAGNKQFIDLLKEAGKDPAMVKAQQECFDCCDDPSPFCLGHLNESRGYRLSVFRRIGWVLIFRQIQERAISEFQHKVQFWFGIQIIVEIFFELSGLSNFDLFFSVFLQYPIDVVLANKLFHVMESHPVFLDKRLIDRGTIDRLDQFELDFTDPADSNQKLERFSNPFAVDVQVFQRFLCESKHGPRADLQIVNPRFHTFFQISC